MDELFPKKFFRGFQSGATHVISIIEETKGSEGEHNPTVTEKHQTDEKIAPC